MIGTRVRHASPGAAAAAIAGFTVANDVSMRDWQYRSLEFLQGKTWEHATPVGPWLVTPDEVGGTEPDLEIRCEVDGVVRQASRTSQLVFSSVDLVAYVSEFVTLEPGDLILTGTPAGVGHGMHPPVYLAAGPGGPHGHRTRRRAREPLPRRDRCDLAGIRADRHINSRPIPPIPPPWIRNPSPSVPKTWEPVCAPCASSRASAPAMSPGRPGWAPASCGPRSEARSVCRLTSCTHSPAR